jgi:hypothetical protein
LRLQAGLEHYWVQCPACAQTFVPQQLPFRLPRAGEAGRIEDNNGEPAAWLGMTPLLGLDANREDEDDGIWHGLLPNFRRDCEPHRALWITLCGTSSLVLGSMGMVLCGVPGLLGLPLGVAAWLMGDHDLKQMRWGLMDPRGFRQTRRGRENGLLGAILSAVFLVGYVVVILALQPF